MSELPKEMYLVNPIQRDLYPMQYVRDTSVTWQVPHKEMLTVGDVYTPNLLWELEAFLPKSTPQEAIQKASLSLWVDRELVLENMPLRTYVSGPSSFGLRKRHQFQFEAMELVRGNQPRDIEDLKGIFLSRGAELNIKTDLPEGYDLEVKLHMGLYKTLNGEPRIDLKEQPHRARQKMPACPTCGKDW